MIKNLFFATLFIFFLIGNSFADGNDSNTVSLLHMDGTDASTTFTDDAAGGTHTWTANNNAQIDTAKSKFGGASGLFDGDTDYVTVPDSDDWTFTGDGTIDFWINFNTVAYAQYISHFPNSNDYWTLGRNSANTDLLFDHAVGGVSSISFSIAWTPSTNTWYHIAFVKSGNDFRFFIDGVSIGTITDTDTIANLASVLYVGARNTAAVQQLDGSIDELRISKGIARWTANFTPPTSAYSVVDDSGQVIWIN